MMAADTKSIALGALKGNCMLCALYLNKAILKNKNKKQYPGKFWKVKVMRANQL